MAGPIYGFIVIVAVMLTARAFGYRWTTGWGMLGLAALFFTGSLLTEIAPLIEGAGYVAWPYVLGALGWVSLVLAVAKISQRRDPDPIPWEYLSPEAREELNKKLTVLGHRDELPPEE